MIKLSEQSLIQKYFAPLSGEGAFGLMDDAALLSPQEGTELVLTTDALVENIHFYSDDDAYSLAQKALRVSLSDLAAKGAKPSGFLLTLGLSEQIEEVWIEKFSQGLSQDIQTFNCPLLGGDSVRSPTLFISITAFGNVNKGQMVQRSGICAGDHLYVTGSIGDAALALRLIARREQSSEHFDALNLRRILPQPRLSAQILMPYVRSAMDVSDGLIGDAYALAQTNHLIVDVNVESVPISDAGMAIIKDDPAAFAKVLSGGDDYELLLAVAPEHELEFLKQAQTLDFTVTKIGHFRNRHDGEDFPSAHQFRYSHF